MMSPCYLVWVYYCILSIHNMLGLNSIVCWGIRWLGKSLLPRLSLWHAKYLVEMISCLRDLLRESLHLVKYFVVLRQHAIYI